jgi:hypothetical protein
MAPRRATAGHRRCRLEDARGWFVAEVSVPDFVTRPDVLLWGRRVFRATRRRDAYREALADTVPPVEPAPEAA